MIFNGIDMCDYLIISDIRRDILPPIITNTRKIPGNIGEYLIGTDLDMRNIEVDITIQGHGRELREQVRIISSLLYTEKEKDLIFKDEPDKLYKAKINGTTNFEEIASIGEGTLQFVCPDPLAYSINKTIINNINNKTIINQGTYDTTGKITVKIGSSVNYVKVTLQNTGEYIYIGDELRAGDEIIINLEDQYIKKNGHLAMHKLHLESDFFKLPVGEFKITLSSGVGILEFRERWL